MINTPRTDGWAEEITCGRDCAFKLLDFARELERENARLREALQWIVDMKDDCYPEEVAAKALCNTEAK